MTKNYEPEKKHKGELKTKFIPVKLDNTDTPEIPKPEWLRIKVRHSSKVAELKSLIKDHKLHTVCQEASCPNLYECYAKGTATFMIMGDKCTRRCTFCDVGHGRPDALDKDEPKNLAHTVSTMGLKYVVITSVDRDDLRDGGAMHFAECINAVRESCPDIKIEILVPDFRSRMEKALNNLALGLPDVFNHNVETVPRLYKPIRPGSDYNWSLKLLKEFGHRFKNIPTKSGIMLGLGESNDEVKQVIYDIREHGCELITIGQYLQPSKFHAPVKRYVSPEEFNELGEYAKSLGFTNVASGPLVRSSYHADEQAESLVEGQL